MTFKLILLTSFFICTGLCAKVKIVTTTPDLKWAAEKIGGDLVEVESLLSGHEDPHYIDAMPHFSLKASRADIFCIVGLDLEAAWVSRVLKRAGNKKLFKGGAGFCDTGANINALDRPEGKIDRSQGDVHSAGNPHFHLGPEAYIQGSRGILNALLATDSTNREKYLENFLVFKQKILSLKNKVLVMLSPVKDKLFMEYHKEFSYYLSEFGLRSAGSIESTPGVPPSAGRIASISLKAKKDRVFVALASNSSPKSITTKFSEISKVRTLRLPMGIVIHEGPTNYPDLILNITTKILENSKKRNGI